MIRKVLFLPFTVASTLFFSLTSVAGGLVGAPKGLYDWIHRNWARSMLWAAGVRVRASGVEHVGPDRAQIFVANHQSMLDIWAMMAALPASLRFITKAELGRIPVFARACRSAGHVFIDRGDPSAASLAIRKAGERMREEGLSLVLFPEGTRSRDGRLGRFKKGGFALAIETRATLVPVALEGGARILPKGAWLPEPGVIHLRCAPPVPLDRLGPEDRDELLERTRATIARLLSEAREEAGVPERAG